MAPISFGQLEGGRQAVAVYGGTPAFHDATIRSLELNQGRNSGLVVQVFQTTSELDAAGHYVRIKPAEVNFILGRLIAVDLSDFRESAILDHMRFEQDAEGIAIEFGSSYGVCGLIKAQQISVTLVLSE